MNKLNEYFVNLYNNEKMTQAFLIGNVLFDDIKEELYEVLKKYILKNESNNIEINPDVFILKQDESLITKEQIKELLNNLSTTSQFNNTKIYIIDKAEKLSDSVYNAILKTLEEPKEGIYAFLITKNIDAVKPTIVSRCQKIFINSNTMSTLDNNEIESLALKFIENVEIIGPKTIAKKTEIYNNISDRETFISVLKIMLEKYSEALKGLVTETNEYNIIISNNDEKSISRKIILIDKTINLLNSYLNKNLSIDRFILEMWRCKI